ncbi:unnamed protein product [Gongylonema pulchrum]|uniref:L-dopachrome tautomerase yellow-f2-like n=1 Tax=Gongylonema pulchrum TaxID=637853 RepID=A0A183D0I6_9BILA|nr:unnamed protein product [Gongylonema pulchrum]
MVQKVIGNARKPLITSWKDADDMVSSTGFINDENSNPIIISLPPNNNFLQHNATLVDSKNRSIWAMNRFRRKKNQTNIYGAATVKLRLTTPPTAIKYYQLPVRQSGLRGVSQIRLPSDFRVAQLRAVNTFEHSVPNPASISFCDQLLLVAVGKVLYSGASPFLMLTEGEKHLGNNDGQRKK